ncbi:gephyrin-like molybdotransferase receptor GlpR [Streptomyces sp. I05A-00742]|uniref:divisome protein SepX/GlpR n=1 Tax=Streptomyces sp. I05A-00742 TaxID=2732853 RepID=UPI001488E730|nr:gephyrin-like molybdotransferase receptor GlpR [Streptomyces sp. I05A-00742]
MSSSGLIYAVIVGAWAAYLVPMWLRRQDELNEARPTERFSTAIRLLSGRAGMERRYAKELERAAGGSADGPAPDAEGEAPAVRAPEPDAATGTVAARPSGAPAPDRAPAAASSASSAASAASSSQAERARRSKVLARRRRTTVLLFLAFTLGAVVAGVGGVAFLWVPGVPAVLLSAYICYLRIQERRRFAFVMDQRRAELAAQRLREGRPRPQQAADPTTVAAPADTVRQAPEPVAPAPEPRAATASPSPSAGRRALVEQTDHAEWVDQQRDRGTEGDGWEPVPVPLPTYVTAPVAPRAGDSADLGTPDTWSAARSSTAGPALDRKPAEDRRGPRPRRRPRERGRTPLFDQYADDDRPRAANE